MTKSNGPLFGSQVVAMIIPHRPPLLLVDRVDDYEHRPVPRLRAGCSISPNHDVFRGHFPDFPIWPGSYTQEGLGQSCMILSLLLRFQKSWEAQGGDPEEVLLAFRNLDRGFHFHPGYKPEISEPLFAPLRLMRGRLGTSAAAEMKFLSPVFPGQQLDYDVRLTGEYGDMLRFEGEATVAGKIAAKGVLTSAEIPIEPIILGLRRSHAAD